jgi:hypothetical protein
LHTTPVVLPALQRTAGIDPVTCIACRSGFDLMTGGRFSLGTCVARDQERSIAYLKEEN